MASQCQFIVCIFLLLQQALCDGDAECVPNANVVTDTSRADRKALLTDLLCDYDRLAIAPKTPVEVFVYVYRLNLDLHRGILRMLVDMSWSWNDPRLTWDSSRYSNIDEITMTSKEIWAPDLDTINTFSIQRDWNEETSPLRCSVTSQGNVTCNPVFTMITNCGSSVRNWPFDRHDCLFEVVSKAYSLTMAYNTSEISTHEKASEEWRVAATEQRTFALQMLSGTLSLTRMEFRITLERNSGTHVATVVIPAVVLSCLVLAQLWMDPIAPSRIMLGCTTVASLCLYLVYLSDTVPDDTEGQAPLIVVFFRDALVIATFVVVLSVAAVGLHGRPAPPPSWLGAASARLLSRIPRPVTNALLLEEDEDEDARSQDADQADNAEADSVEKAEVPATWGKLARLLDRISFVILTLTFLGLMIATVP